MKDHPAEGTAPSHQGSSNLQSPSDRLGLSMTRLRFIFWSLVLHEFVVAFEFLFNPPTNIFTALKVPVTALSSQLTAILLHRSNLESLPPHLTNLLNRLQSFDTRTYYIRFGHETIVTCTHCRTLYDYLLVHVSKVSLEYIRLAGLVTLMTIYGGGKQKWRRWSLAAVIAAFAAEMWTITTVEVRIPRNGIGCEMWHDNIWYLRHAFLFVLPLVLHFLPYSTSSPSPFSLLNPVLIHLDRIHKRLGLYSLVHSAAQRDPQLQANTAEYWRAMEQESTAGRQSTDVNMEAERLGMGFERKERGKPEGRWKLREEAGRIVENIIETLQGLKVVMPERPRPSSDARPAESHD